MARTRWVYMLHYRDPIGDTTRPRMWAQHYVGSFWEPARIEQHRTGTSRVAIVAAFHAQDIPFDVVLLRRGSKDLERRIKQNGHFKNYCPVCTRPPWKGLWVTVTPRRKAKGEGRRRSDDGRDRALLRSSRQRQLLRVPVQASGPALPGPRRLSRENPRRPPG